MSDPADELTRTREFCGSKTFITQCKEELGNTGVCVIPDFLPQAAIARSLANARTALGQAHQIDHAFEYDDAYDNPLGISLASLPPTHPRHTRSLTRIKFIAKDLIDPAMMAHPN